MLREHRDRFRRGTLKSGHVVAARGGGTNLDDEGVGVLGGDDDGAALPQAGDVGPDGFVDAARSGFEDAEVLGAGGLVDDFVVGKLEEFGREVLGRLGDEVEGEPAFAAPAGDAAELVEGLFHFVVLFAGDEAVRFFDGDEDLVGGVFGFAHCHFVAVGAGEEVGDDDVDDLLVADVGHVKDGEVAGGAEGFNGELRRAFHVEDAPEAEFAELFPQRAVGGDVGVVFDEGFEGVGVAIDFHWGRIVLRFLTFFGLVLPFPLVIFEFLFEHGAQEVQGDARVAA